MSDVERRVVSLLRSRVSCDHQQAPTAPRVLLSPLAEFQGWAACPHFLLIVPQREVANFRDLDRDLQEVT